MYASFIKRGHELQGHATAQGAQIPGHFTAYMVQYQCDIDQACQTEGPRGPYGSHLCCHEGHTRLLTGHLIKIFTLGNNLTYFQV